VLPPAAPTQVDAGLRAAATASRDHAELLAPAVVAALRGTGPLLDPTPEARGRMRRRVLLAADPSPRPDTAPAPGPAPGPDRLRRRFLAAAAVVAALAGVGATAAQAVPGDATFPLRAGADRALVELSALGGARSGAELAVAGRRLDDLPGAGAGRAALLADAVAHLRAGSRAGTAAGVAGDVGQLVTLHDWAAARAADLAGSRVTGATAAELRADLAAVVARTDAVALRLGCREITDGTDELGPRPATSPCRADDPTVGTGVALPVVAPVGVDGLRSAR
jgi:hypothetical protein